MHEQNIADRLGHLLFFNIHKAIVHPEPGKLFAPMGAAALGQFIFVVGKLQINPAPMNINRIAQMRLNHCRTFNVPTRTAASPRAIPPNLVIAARLPQHEIRCIFFIRRNFDTRPCFHLVLSPAR